MQNIGPGHIFLSIPVQVDLVLDAESFWVLPFEACLDQNDQPLFADRTPPVVLTRRIRGEFVGKHRKWPKKPRVLFISARKTSDVKQTLVDANRDGLLKALEPWLGGNYESDDPDHFGTYLSILSDPNLRDIEVTCAQARAENNPFTHIHILAHGTLVGLADGTWKSCGP
jgi:hypothetical protein